MKRLHLLLLTLILPTAIFAQVSGGYGAGISRNDNMNKVDVGVEGSPSLSFLRGNDMLQLYNNPAVGYSGGLFFQYNSRKIYSFRTSIDFEQKGNVILYPANGKARNNFNYMTMPFLAKMSLGKKIKYFVEAGPFIGYLISERTFTSYKNAEALYSDYRTNFFKQFDWGLATGLGLSIPLRENFSFSCELRNNLGLSNVSAVEVINNGTIKTNSTNLLFGLSYRFGKRTYIVPA